jgi:apolipoprotein D and lipocalin family protein
MVWGDYWVVGLADDYSWAVVGSPDRKYLWVLSRTPNLARDAEAKAWQAIRDNGFDVGRLMTTRHTNERRGLPCPEM